ncbi:MAG TPA: hypothetical protein VIY08_05705 [Candidatus Nitrosocosmicus sp.]
MKISISGIRGIFEDDLSIQIISKYSRLFGTYLRNNFNHPTCTIARDSRPSSNIINDIVVGSILEQGINIYDLGVVPTPVLFREARKYNGSIMITASHNPLEWNGLKLLVNGRGLFEEELDEMLKNNIHPYKQIGEYYKINASYLDDITNYLACPNHLSSDFKVGLDFGGGATCNYINRLFQKYKIKYLSINDRFGFSSRGPDPTSNPLIDLQELVKLNRLNFGFAFDMDGDRLVIINDKGESLSPDLTLLLCISGAIQTNIKKFTISLDSSITIDKYIKNNGGEISYSKVGESNVLRKIIESNAQAGGEGSSGGFILPSFTSCRDGLLASILICSLNPRLINECLDLASKYMQIRTKIPVKPEVNLSEFLEKISKTFTPDSYKVINEDGFKFMLDENTWTLVRPSNTEHVLRISLESEKNRINYLYKLIYGKINEIYEKIR